MPLPVQKFREAVFQILYSYDFGFDSEGIVPMMMEELKCTKRNMTEAEGRAKDVFSKLKELDERIEAQSTEYSFDRISRVEKTILRLSLYELLFDKTVPPKVAIAEAIRLSRKFGTPESSQFVNAILDGVYKNDESQVREEPVSF